MPPSYTVRMDAEWKVHANPTFTPIDAPDASLDRGYIIVRHHEFEARREATRMPSAISNT